MKHEAAITVILPPPPGETEGTVIQGMVWDRDITQMLEKYPHTVREAESGIVFLDFDWEVEHPTRTSIYVRVID